VRNLPFVCLSDGGKTTKCSSRDFSLINFVLFRDLRLSRQPDTLQAGLVYCCFRENFLMMREVLRCLSARADPLPALILKLPGEDFSRLTQLGRLRGACRVLHRCRVRDDGERPHNSAVTLDTFFLSVLSSRFVYIFSRLITSRAQRKVTAAAL
jgi:hypothetical protein